MKLKIALILLLCFYKGFCEINPKENPNKIWEEMLFEIETVEREYFLKKELISLQLQKSDFILNKSATWEEKLCTLIREDDLYTDLQNLRYSEMREVGELRYLKGLQIIKLLYEKMFSLDHHFSDVSTLRDVNKISIPNNYSEFAEMKDK